MIYKTVLDNGLTLVLDYDSNAKTITTKYVVAAGSIDEQGIYKGKNNFGVMHFLEHMTFKGTDTRTYEDINNDIASIGAITNAYTSQDEIAFYISSPAEYWKENLNILSDIFWNSTIPEDEFIKEKTVIIEELKMYADDPKYQVINQLNILIHKNNPSRQRVAGTIASVHNLTVDDIKRVKKCFFVPNNVLLVVAGNFPKDKLIAEVISLVQTKEKQIIPAREIEYTNDILNNQLLRSTKADIEQSHFAFTIKGVPPYHEDFATMEIIADLLGGGFTSRLYNIIREQQGLAYTVSASIASIRDAGYIDGYVGLDASNIPAVHKIIIHELNRLRRELVPEKELNILKALYKGQLLLCNEPTAAKTRLHENNFINNTDYTLEDIIEQIDNITSDKILRFAKKYFIKDNICLSVIEPKR